jgi:protein O-mannosyl-transferase
MAHRTSLLASGFIASLALLVYLNGLQAPFVYDDHRTVVENTSIQELSDWRAIVLLQPLRPVLNFSFALDYALWGLNPVGYRLTNVLLHILNALLLFRVVVLSAADHERTRSDHSSSTPVGLGTNGSVGRPEVVGLAAALLFAIHPMMTSAVTYVSGRSEVLCATFFLAAFLSARRGLVSEGRRWWVLSTIFWLLALATKEIAAMFPIVLLGYERFVLRLENERRRRAVQMLIALVSVAALAAVARVTAFTLVEYRGDVSFEWRFLFVELNVIVQYLALMVMPEGQTIFHAVPMSGPFDLRTLWSAAVIITLLVIAWRARARAGLVTFGVLWFLVLLVPSSVLVLLDRAEPMAEHRVYLASCGLFLVAGAAVEWAFRHGTLKTRRTRLMLQAVMVIALLSLAGRSVLRNAVWSDPVGLWRESVAKAPDHWLPHLLLGEALHAAGRHDEAIAEYRRGIDLRPDQELAYQKLARAWLETGRASQAWAAFDELRARLPQSPVAANGLGALALLGGDREGARAHFQEALAHDRWNVTARQSLALIAETEPVDAREALRLCEEIQQLAPRTPGNDDCINRNRARLAASEGK